MYDIRIMYCQLNKKLHRDKLKTLKIFFITIIPYEYALTMYTCLFFLSTPVLCFHLNPICLPFVFSF